MSPFVLVTFLQGAWEIAHYNPTPYYDGPLANRLPVPHGQSKVVWIIFDEMDQRLAFDERLPSLALPEFDGFRREAWYADHAYPPADDTAMSVPSLISGLVVPWVEGRGVSDLELFLKDGTRPLWKHQDTIFARARGMGVNVAALGWYHPYCRQFSRDMTNCQWWEGENSVGHSDAGLAELFVNQPRSLFETTVWAPWGQTITAEWHAQMFQEMLHEAKQEAADPGLGLVFLHLPAPHKPYVYDRTTGQFTLRHSPARGYWDALALADRALGEIRQAMERNGTWNQAVVLLTADHHYRWSESLDGKTDRRVPFLLKLPDQHIGVEFHDRLQTVVTKELLLAMLNGSIHEPAELTQWISAHGAVAGR